MTPTFRLGALALVLSAVLPACDENGPVAPPVEAPAAPYLAALDCTAGVASATVSCRSATPSTGQAPGLIVGGQGEFVLMTGTNAAYTAIDSAFKFDATVQNLIPQPLGTTDGTTPDPAGVRVFFSSMPASATGAVTVRNASGTATFLNGDAPYFQYDGNLAQNATSGAVTWRFTVDPTVATFTFKVYVAAQVPYPNGWVDVSPPADTLMADSAQPLTATVRDVVGRAIPGQTITWGTSDAAIGTVTAGGVVTGVSPGAVTISASSGVRSGTAKIAVCPRLAVGGVYVADMPAGAEICLPGTTGGAEYTVMPMNLSPSTAGGLTLGLTSTGIVAASGTPNPARLPGARLGVAGGLRRDDAWETRLRHAERRELGPLLARGVARGAGPRRAISTGIPVVGSLMTLNVSTASACGTPDNRTGRVMHVGTRLVVVADTANPSGLTTSDYEAIANTFDAQVWPSITAAYGEPADLDQNGGRVIAFYTRAVNELTPPGSSSYVGGFVFARDLFEPAQCPSSNRTEMFYMLAADPTGVVNGNVRSVDLIKSKTVGTLAHEFEHLINASRRMYVNGATAFEATWLDEGLAHVAEELMFYHVSGRSARANLGGAQLFDGGAVQSAWFSYMESNTGRLRQWLLSPTTGGFFQANDNLATRGAAWSFLRYAADRKGGTEATFWGALVKTAQDTGLVNLQNALGTAPMPWARDFVAATYADDAVGSGVAAQYTLPSWNVRDIIDNWIDYTAGDRYPLALRAPANGVADNISLAYGGSAAFSRVGVPASAFASVRLRVSGGNPPSTVRVAVFRRK